MINASIGYADQAQTAPATQSEIERELNRLMSALSYIESAAHELAAKMTPVIRGEAPEKEAVGTPKAICASQVGATLQEQADKVERLAGALVRLRERLCV